MERFVYTESDTRGSVDVDVPFFVVSQMVLFGETGVQTHMNGFLRYLGEIGREAHFVGPIESVKSRLIPRVIMAVIRRAPFRGTQIVRHLQRVIAFKATCAELQLRLRGKDSWCIYAQDLLSARAGLRFKSNNKQRVVLAVHFNVSQADEMVDRKVLRRFSWLYRLIQREERDVLVKADSVVFFSEFMRKVVIDCGLVLRHVAVIPHTAAKPQPGQTTEARDLLAIGTLEPRKNQKYLLEVLHEAESRGHRYTLTVVGGGEDRAFLERLAHKFGIADRVWFAGSVLPASSLLIQHKILVHAAKVENVGIALIEGLAAGKPILAPRVGGIPEIYADGVEGFFWPLDDAAAGAELLIRVMENNELYMAMCIASAKRYTEHFERTAIFSRLTEFVVSDTGREDRASATG